MNYLLYYPVTLKGNIWARAKYGEFKYRFLNISSQTKSLDVILQNPTFVILFKEQLYVSIQNCSPEGTGTRHDHHSVRK